QVSVVFFCEHSVHHIDDRFESIVLLFGRFFELFHYHASLLLLASRGTAVNSPSAAIFYIKTFPVDIKKHPASSEKRTLYLQTQVASATGNKAQTCIREVESRSKILCFFDRRRGRGGKCLFDRFAVGTNRRRIDLRRRVG